MTCPAFSFCSCLYPGPCWTTTKYCMHLCIATPYIYIRTSTLLRMHMPHLYSYKYDIQCTNFVCTYSMYVIIFPSRTALHVYSIFGFSIHLGTNQIRVVESFIRVRNETSHPGQERNETKRNEKQNIRVPGLVKSLSGLRPKPVNRVRNETISGLLLFKTMTQVYYI